MSFFKRIFLFLVFFGGTVGAFSQAEKTPKMHDIFLAFIQKKLALNPQESGRMRPLVIRYFNETRKIHQNFTDPLIREQQKIDLKIRYRNLFSPIIGKDRSNRFFAEEQLFRKRVREELRQRKKV
ncbi:MAG: hypothetical protein BGN92_11490 [Sphingobacteriales bacterium 41-5]|nr:MAG: hypothetical protein ABS67_02345 [Niabella sp. SCN 42-15]OJU27927.1 MAG: hypothetical protein BGN92_11490 [Sphingobacteriales bacterium 41-5]